MEISGCPLPDDRYYDLANEVWWKEDGPRAGALVGLLATFSSFAGVFQSVEFRPVRGAVERGRSIATVESRRLTAPVRLPVDAEILAWNDSLLARPRLLNDAPYSEGWIARVRPMKPDEPARILASSQAIAPQVEAQIRARRIRCWPQVPDVELDEIGLECSAVLAKLSEEVARRDVGDAVLLVTDDPTSPIEMVRWSDRTGYPVLIHRREGALHQFLVRKIAVPLPRLR